MTKRYFQGLLLLLSFLSIAVVAIANPELEAAKNALDDLKADTKYVAEKLAEAQHEYDGAKQEYDEAKQEADTLKSEYETAPNADLQRRLKDAEFQAMLKERRAKSAEKSLDRAQRNHDEAKQAENDQAKIVADLSTGAADGEAAAQAEADAKAAEAAAAQAKADEEAAAKAAAEAKAAEAAAAQAKADEEAAAKAAAEAKAAEAAAAQAKAEEEAAVEAKAAEAAAAEAKAEEEAATQTAVETNTTEAVAEQAKADKVATKAIPQVAITGDCIPLPSEATNPSAELTPIDKQLKVYAAGELRRINALINSAPASDQAPIEHPVLAGNKLKPCDQASQQALLFDYQGNGQYKLESRVLAGEQAFWVDGVIDPIRRKIPETDNGELYVFFLDLKYKGRYKLVAYKKSLIVAGKPAATTTPAEPVIEEFEAVEE